MKLEEGTEEFAEAFSLLSERNKALVISGDVDMWEGREGQPVLRYSASNSLGKKTGTLVPGTSLLPNPNHGNVGKLGRKGDYKRTNAYKDLINYISPATDDPNIYGGLAWLLEQGFKMVEGGDFYAKVTCPECHTHFNAPVFKKGDPKALATILDHVIGKPEQNTTVSGQVEHLHDYLRETDDSRTIEVKVVDPKESERRRKELDYDI